MEQVKQPKKKYRAKFLHFHENRRPAYYGTWRKKSKKVSGKNPFGVDLQMFDYEVDSDEEWEEEEPGESLHGSDDEKDKDNVDDDYEVSNIHPFLNKFSLKTIFNRSTTTFSCPTVTYPTKKSSPMTISCPKTIPRKPKRPVLRSCNKNSSKNTKRRRKKSNLALSGAFGCAKVTDMPKINVPQLFGRCYQHAL